MVGVIFAVASNPNESTYTYWMGVRTLPVNVGSGSNNTVAPDNVYTPSPATVTDVAEQLVVVYGRDAANSHNFKLDSVIVALVLAASLVKGEYV